MSAPIPESVAESILVKCGRCCCLCRRFKPTMLQVHHIEPSAKGGSNDEDNLIALCITCHSDVHTLRPFTRRFSVQELKDHRNCVFELVRQGQLVPPSNERFELSDNTLQESLKALTVDASCKLPLEFMRFDIHIDMNTAIDILVSAADSKFGDIIIIEASSGLCIQSGNRQFDDLSARDAARFRAALDSLEGSQLIEPIGVHGYRVTHRGYLVADQLLAVIAKNRNCE